MMFYRIFLGILLIYSGCNGCSDRSSPAIQKLGAASNDFALNLYQRLAREDGASRNIIFSPLSVESSLAMVLLGARNKTAEQFTSALKLEGLGDDILHQAFSDLAMSLNTADQNGYELKVANGLFARPGYTFREEFLNKMQHYYKTEALNLDFARKPDESIDIINRWVEKQTEHKITDLISDIDPLAAMILVNAIYFKGEWQTKFDSTLTTEDDFHMSETETVKTQMMHRTGDLKYAANKELGATAVELPYTGEDVSMVIILPDEVNGLAVMESKLTSGNLRELLQCPYTTEFSLSLPKFSVEYSTRLEDPLKELGMADAFSPGIADLSGMDGTRNLYLSKVAHKAALVVGESGSEAAAATMDEVYAMSMPLPPRPFTADQPFMVVIKHKPSATVLFMGRVAQPLNH